jgi:glycosyltransferase involved in cell wall biosynthesis
MNSSNNPLISVVMPVLNGEKYLRSAMESILNQSISDFEFIIINDGSTDETETIIKSFNDQIFVYKKHDSNLGLAKSFNIGIREARGKFIARMDADDVSMPNRLKQQLDFLEHHQDTGLVGSSVILVDENNRPLKKHSRPASHLEIKWSSLFSNPLIHSTVMAWSEILKNNLYDENFTNSEDYELWSRLLFTTDIKLANIQEPLLFYRTYKQSFTQKLNPDRKLSSAENSIRNIEHYTALNQEEKNILILIRQEKPISIRQACAVWKMYRRASRQFCLKEKIKLSETLTIYSKLFSYAFFLLKYQIKKSIRA